GGTGSLPSPSRVVERVGSGVRIHANVVNPKLPFASRKDLDFGAQGLWRKSTIPPDSDRPVRTVAGHDAALNPDAVRAEPYRAGADGLCSDVHAGHLDDCLIAVLF